MTHRLRRTAAFFLLFFLLGGDGERSSELDDFTRLKRTRTA